MCHLVLLLPLLALPVFWFEPPGVALAIYMPILALSLWVYWIAFKVMHRPVQTGREQLLQATGRVVHTTGGTIYVRIHGETWQAVSTDPLRSGDDVKVLEMDGLRLRVGRTGSVAHISSGS